MGRKNYSRFFAEEPKKEIENIHLEDPKAPKEPKAEEPAKPVVKFGKVVNCEMVNVRSKADPDAPIASVIYVGEEVEVYEDKSKDLYYAVKTNHGIEGFIKKDFVEV